MNTRQGGPDTGVQTAIAARASMLVQEAHSLAEALEGLAGMLGESAALSRASLRMVDQDELVIVAVWTRGSTALPKGTRMPIRGSAFPDVLRESGPVVHEGPNEQPSLLDQILIDEGNRSWVLIPLHEHGATVGVLAFTSRVSRAFHREDAPVYAAVGRAIEEPLLDLVKSGRFER